MKNICTCCQKSWDPYTPATHKYKYNGHYTYSPNYSEIYQSIVLNMWWFCHDYNGNISINFAVMRTVKECVVFSRDLNGCIEV